LQGAIVRDDHRYLYVENFLRSRGCVFHEADARPEGLDFVIFPFAADVDKSVFDDHYFAGLREGVRIFSGIRNAYLTERCAARGLNYHAIMEDRGIAVKNAVPTSEGVIAYLVTRRTDTLAGSRMLVIGYGVCGSDLSKRLTSLGVDVYALVRTPEKEAQALADGVTPIYLDKIFEIDFDTIINTVPGTVLTDEMLERKRGSLFVDIASKPYGFNMETAKRLNEKSALLPGIPGKYAVRTSGEILGEYIFNILRGNA